jgi:hypothetical protein
MSPEGSLQPRLGSCLNNARDLSVECGTARRGSVFYGGANLSWPLAVLELRPDSIRVGPRRLANRFLPPVEISLADVTSVETDFGWTGRLRFRLVGAGDGTVFWTRGRAKVALVDALRRAGLTVE